MKVCRGNATYILCYYCLHARVIHLKCYKGETITKALQKVAKKSIRNRNKLWVDKGSDLLRKILI